MRLPFATPANWSCWMPMSYVNSFIEASARHVPEGFRLPSVTEAEEADRRVLLEVFRLVYQGWSMDSALQSVFGERDLFRQYLVCMPRAMKKQQPIPAKGKHSGRTRRELDSPPLNRRKQICFDHKKGKCHRGDACKFSHELACNSTGAGRWMTRCCTWPWSCRLPSGSHGGWFELDILLPKERIAIASSSRCRQGNMSKWPLLSNVGSGQESGAWFLVCLNIAGPNVATHYYLVLN